MAEDLLTFLRNKFYEYHAGYPTLKSFDEIRAKRVELQNIMKNEVFCIDGLSSLNTNILRLLAGTDSMKVSDSESDFGCMHNVNGGWKSLCAIVTNFSFATRAA